MNLQQTIDILAGGPGSGRHPQHGNFKLETRDNGGLYKKGQSLKNENTLWYRANDSKHGEPTRVEVKERTTGSGKTKLDVMHKPADTYKRTGSYAFGWEGHKSGKADEMKKYLKDYYGIDHKLKEERDDNFVA